MNLLTQKGDAGLRSIPDEPEPTEELCEWCRAAPAEHSVINIRWQCRELVCVQCFADATRDE